MIEGIPRISVLIISYKQEELIKRAVDSLLAQKDYVYEICVSDDCSPDKTWEVLNEYYRQYPGLFKLNRNEPNLGIFANYEKTWTMPTGDIIYPMAGDDECGSGWFERICKYIIDNHIDYKNERFCIYGDYQVRYPNGDSLIFSNADVQNDRIHPFTLALRHLICNRSACLGSSVFRKFQKVSVGRSHIAEEILDRQQQIFSDKSYYIKKVGNIYYAGVGVSASMKGRKTDAKTHEERQQLADYTIQKAAELGYEVCEKDKNYLYFTKTLFQAKYTGKLSDYLKAFDYYIKSYNPKIGLKGLRMKRIVFAIRRRLPHKNPITMTI